MGGLSNFIREPGRTRKFESFSRKKQKKKKKDEKMIINIIKNNL